MLQWNKLPCTTKPLSSVRLWSHSSEHHSSPQQAFVFDTNVFCALIKQEQHTRIFFLVKKNTRNSSSSSMHFNKSVSSSRSLSKRTGKKIYFGIKFYWNRTPSIPWVLSFITKHFSAQKLLIVYVCSCWLKWALKVLIVKQKL